MRILYSSDSSFDKSFEEILARGKMDMEGVTDIVATLLSEISEKGDEAVVEQVSRFDRWEPSNANDLIIDKK